MGVVTSLFRLGLGKEKVVFLWYSFSEVIFMADRILEIDGYGMDRKVEFFLSLDIYSKS